MSLIAEEKHFTIEEIAQRVVEYLKQEKPFFIAFYDPEEKQYDVHSNIQFNALPKFIATVMHGISTKVPDEEVH